MDELPDVRARRRAVIEFLCAEGETPVNMHKRMEKVYGASCVDISTVRRWVVQFNRGERELRDSPRSGRPATAVTEENKERVDALIKDECRIRRQQLCNIVGIGHSGMDAIIEGLGYRKICVRRVPRMLTAVHKENRKATCADLLHQYQRDGPSAPHPPPPPPPRQPHPPPPPPYNPPPLLRLYGQTEEGHNTHSAARPTLGLYVADRWR